MDLAIHISEDYIGGVLFTTVVLTLIITIYKGHK